jgi:two-component system sensor histidine kinase KdpD
VVGKALRACHAVLSHHHVVMRVTEQLPLVHFDAVLIERVLWKLLENAGQYTPPGTTVTVCVERHGMWLNIVVADDGPGLPAGQEEAVFDKFMRGAHQSSTPGVGLGLAICRAIVEAHGGAIRAFSPPQGGAAFVFTLPLGTPPPMAAAQDETVAATQRE